MQFLYISMLLSLLSGATAIPMADQTEVAGAPEFGQLSSVVDYTLDKREFAANETELLDWQKSVLNYTNGVRAHHQAAPLKWNATLAAAARAQASRCIFQLTNPNPYGESIGGGTYQNAAYYVSLWYNGIRSYNFNYPGWTSQTGAFSQLVWRSTTDLGCAFVKGCAGPYPNMLFCEYATRGNVLPAFNFAQNVLRPVPNPPAPFPPAPYRDAQPAL